MKRFIQTLTLLAVLLTACVQPTPEPTPTLTPLPFLTPTITPTATPYLSPTPTPYQTPLPLSDEEASRLILELYETNGGCELPCWWGITPGETSLETALDLLLSIGRISDDTYRYKNLSVYQISINVPDDFEYFTDFGVYLRTPTDKSDPYYGIVTGISIYETFTKQYKDYTLADYLSLFGEPDQIYIDIFWDFVAFNLFYLEKGITIHSELNKNKLFKESEFLTCPQNDVTWYWNLWNPHTVVLDDMVDYRKVGDIYFPLEEVTDLTIHEFYEIYLDPETEYCVEGGVDVEP